MATTTTTTTAQKVQVDEKPSEHKAFIRNLAYKSTKESLTAFAETSGKVVEATVVKRGHRSLGFGFITFATEADVIKAVTDLDKKELDGRVVHLEIAHAKTGEEKSKAEPKEKPKESKKKSNKGESKEKVSKEEPKEKEPKEKVSKEKVSKEKEPKEKVSKEKVSKEEPKEKVSKEESKEKVSKEEPKEKVSTDEPKVAETEAKAEGKKQRRKKNNNKKKAVKKTRATEPSKTTLFVANLPYATTDDDLKKLFAAYTLVSAQVSRMRNGRSKGYGFVELESEQDQRKALESLKDINLDGRAVYLKVALSELPPSSSSEETPVEEKLPEDKEKPAVVQDTK